jgi:hypothetical protein
LLYLSHRNGMSLKMAAFWVVAIHSSPWWWRQYRPLKRWWIHTSTRCYNPEDSPLHTLPLSEPQVLRGIVYFALYVVPQHASVMAWAYLCLTVLRGNCVHNVYSACFIKQTY